jgi:uncharacterized membrane protein YeaQ/YmgE (transglycosylase-associated protein family)
MGILSWIVMGFIVGLLARFIMPGRDPGGIIITILLGIAGGLVGGFIGSFLGLGTVTGFNVGSFLLAIAGLSDEVVSVQTNVDKLVRDIESAIAQADAFIASLQAE